MNDLKTVRDALDIAAYQCEFLPKKMEVINKAYEVIDRMIETPAPTEKLDVDALKYEVRGADLGDNGECYSDDVIDYLANTGRLR